ncbi:MAG: Tetratricopeptide 2 repeat protein [Rariglobus sp.]|jgi:hypothetical protein|nr:Tetratricopeptide 2 repeat protein [Rariglobus sp.]
MSHVRSLVRWSSLAGALTLALLTTAQPAFAAKPKKPDKDFILKEYQAASLALRRGDFASAKISLDSAITAIGGIVVDEAGAKKARSLWSDESAKLFIGEPYERVMAFYYRGILYWMDGEADNARACFRSAQFIDADVENKAYASDYVTLDYLDGLATAKLGGDGKDAYERAAKLTSAPLPALDAAGNTLVFVEFGQGPLKVAEGKNKELLKVVPGVSPITGAVVKLGDQAIPLAVLDDVNFQATTRGGRVMDHVLGNKAVFKESTGTVGDVALAGAATSLRLGGSSDLSAGLAIGGVLFKGASMLTKTKADTRAWDTLPGRVGFISVKLAPGEHAATVEFIDETGKPVVSRPVVIKVAAEQPDTVIFVSDRAS